MFGGAIEIQICIQMLLVFCPLSPQVAAVSLHFGSILAPFWRHLGSILHHFGVLCLPLGLPAGILGGGMFFYPFLEAKNGRKVEPQRIPKSIKNRCRNHCFFFDPFLGAFWYLLIPLSEGHGGPPDGNLHGHVV